jgi:hypothetical protein
MNLKKIKGSFTISASKAGNKSLGMRFIGGKSKLKENSHFKNIMLIFGVLRQPFIPNRISIDILKQLLIRNIFLFVDYIYDLFIF